MKTLGIDLSTRQLDLVLVDDDTGPYAAALSTAMTVKRDGGWRQWAASRPCHGLR